jgi:hypothetical protein
LLAEKLKVEHVFKGTNSPARPAPPLIVLRLDINSTAIPSFDPVLSIEAFFGFAFSVSLISISNSTSETMATAVLHQSLASTASAASHNGSVIISTPIPTINLSSDSIEEAYETMASAASPLV